MLYQLDQNFFVIRIFQACVDCIPREIRKKTVLNQSDGTITYVMNRTFHFEEDYSNYSESDLITTINFVYVVNKAVYVLMHIFYCRF